MTLAPVDIRPEQPADHDAVARVHRAAFGDEGERVSRLVDAIRPTIGPGNGLSLVAEVGGVIAAHIMFSRSLLDAPRKLVPVQVLSPLAVSPPHQGHGIGGALVGRGLELMAQSEFPLVFLEGSPTYYPRFGFRPGGELGFRKPSLRIPDRAFQVAVLPSYEPWMTGTLVYSSMFWEHDAVGLRDSDA